MSVQCIYIIAFICTLFLCRKLARFKWTHKFKNWPEQAFFWRGQAGNRK